MFKTTERFCFFILTVVFFCTTLLTSSVSAAATKPLRITTSFYPMYIAALNLTKGVQGIEVRNLTKPMTGCLHDYNSTTDDMKQLDKTDIFIVNGAGMESFLDKVIKQKPDIKIISASDGIQTLKDSTGENPHVWVSISLHIKQIRIISSRLAALDPTNRREYNKNADIYVVKLEKLRSEMIAGLKGIKTRDIITLHEAFPYFAKEFGLNVVAVIEREPGSEPNAREMASTINLVRKTRVKAMFAEPQYPSKAAQTVTRETDAKLYILDPVVTGPMKDDAYIEIMKKNLRQLQKALN
ncbi:MAG: zinc ABC transporter substrate-binding protein [Desulfuromonadaceae bacterium]|nr:zinc ABC transporter substrate-binding protein [Desulfuromonadaceae bacterium]